MATHSHQRRTRARRSVVALVAGGFALTAAALPLTACDPGVGPTTTTTTTTSTTVPAPALSNVLYINLQSGREDLHRVNMAFQMARGQRALGRPVTMFFNINAPELATTSLTEALKWRDNDPIKTQLAALIESGVKILVCPTCSADQGVTADQLVSGARMANPQLNAAELQPGTVTMSY